ncbi:nucleoside-diphosphate-sugar epimerase [Rhodococcus gordoniae]|uniref:Nucleoside-diphosphate-sugar epimerase n=1 Tax=Rhodococcus gordoniae TaxID=223392 RepID=A0A379LVN2_9NOCA|nr:hypothetical protein [Rhodococcus gordoniae]SUE14097.1 nucleoside-diphosphate-sugar epimerase [Rhodococcus gordoniae]
MGAVVLVLRGDDVDELLLMPGREVEQRPPRHTDIIDAAKTTSVAFITDTSLLLVAPQPVDPRR